MARHLAECGFLYAWADDCWDFAQAWVTDARNNGRDLSTVREHLDALDVSQHPAGHPHEPGRLVDFMSLLNAPVVTTTQPPPDTPAPFLGGPTVSLGGIITAPACFPHHPPRGETTSALSAAPSEIAPSEVPSSMPDGDEIMDP